MQPTNHWTHTILKRAANAKRSETQRANARRRKLLDAVKALSVKFPDRPHHLGAFLLVLIEGHDYDHVTRVYGINRGCAYAWVHRGKKLARTDPVLAAWIEEKELIG